MKYRSIEKAVFIKRHNRFIASVLLNGREETVHVKNTGRLKEILQEGTTVLLERSGNTARKTGYSLIGAYKGSTLINIDSQAINTAAFEAITLGRLQELPEAEVLRREVRYGNSRFDLYFEASGRRGFIEVKGVTLEKDGIALFPDAPTERGAKHVYEMMDAVKNGYTGILLFVIQLKGVTRFMPHRETDPAFSDALKAAANAGVSILAYDCLIEEDGIHLSQPVGVTLG